MSRTVRPTLAAVALLTLGGATAAPTTAPDPTTAPAPDAELRRAFDRLADADPGVRDAARDQLMGLSGDDLPKLLDVVRAARPVRPAQAVALHEIVTQAYQAAEPYVAAGDADDPTHALLRQYMIGIYQPFDMQDMPPRLGVLVSGRIPGFPGGRLLRDGDMILGVYLNPNLPLDQAPNALTHQFKDLQDAVLEGAPPRTRVVLAVLRGGQQVRVPVALVPRPAVAGEGFIQGRQHRAEVFWEETFVPVLEPEGVPGDGEVPGG